MESVAKILPFVYTAIILFFLWKKNPLKKYEIPPVWITGIFLLKILAGTALWAVYTYHYTDRSTSDAFRFFDDAKIMHSALFNEPVVYLKMLFGIDTNDPAIHKYAIKMFNWDKEYNYFLYNDNRTMLRFNALCMLLSFGNYHVHTIFMSLVSLTGGLFLFKAFYRFLSDKKYLLLLIVFCIPSVIFYTSGVLKEGIVLTGLGLFFYGFFEAIAKPKSLVTWLAVLLGTFILLIMKIYVILCLIPAIVYFISSKFIFNKRPIIYFLLFHVLVFAFLYLISVIFPDKDIFYMLFKKRDDFSNVAMLYDAGSFISTPDLMPNAGSFLLYIPFALYTVCMRPYFWEAGSMLVKAAGLENMFMLLAMCLPIVSFKKLNSLEKRITYMLLVFVLYLYILIGFTTPVLGALSRYKVPALPVLFIICLFYVNSAKLKKIVSFKHL